VRSWGENHNTKMEDKCGGVVDCERPKGKDGVSGRSDMSRFVWFDHEGTVVFMMSVHLALSEVCTQKGA
jgi:hypothetical protein